MSDWYDFTEQWQVNWVASVGTNKCNKVSQFTSVIIRHKILMTLFT